MQVKLPVDLPKISLRGVDYPVVGRIATIPDEYLPDLLLAFPQSEEVTWDLSNQAPKPPFDDGHNKV